MNLEDAKLKLHENMDGQVSSNDELIKLKRELDQKNQEIEILKKVVAMFSQDQ